MIVVPYTELAPATAAALPEALFVRMVDDDHYRRLLAAFWERGEAFTLVEHDVSPTRAQLDELESCPRPWCHYGYYPGHWIPVFGCVRFSAELIAGTQGVWDDESWPWCQLDAKFATAARALGFRAHWHSPHVRHGGARFVDADGVTTGEIPRELLLHTLEVEVERLQEMR